MMSENHSNIFEVIRRDEKFWGDLSVARVEVLEGDDFVARYTDTVELGETVLRGVMYCGLPAPVYSVSSWNLDVAIRASRSMAKSLGEDPDKAEQKAILEHESRQPITREEATTIVEKKLKKAHALEVYEDMGKFRRTFEVAKYMCGRTSQFVPHFERHHTPLPQIIELKLEGQPKEFIIDKKLDDKFARS